MLFDCKKATLTKEEKIFFNMLDGNKSFLIKLYSLIFINSNSLTNPSTVSNTRNKFRSNFYFLYNSVYFTSYSRKLNKFKLSEFFSSKLNNLEEKKISVMYDSKKKIGFGKLTWYWVFKMMSGNRFLLNFKEYRNSLSVVKFSFYEMALKSYEKNYNNWLYFSNKSTEDLNTLMIKKRNRAVFKHYSKSNYRSVLTNNRLRHKPITDEFKKTRLSFESNKVYRKMPRYSQPSVRRFRRFKRKRRIFFRKNFLFSKYWRAPYIRVFKKKVIKFEKDVETSFNKWKPVIFKKNIRVFSSIKYWEKKMKKSLWSLRRARSDYIGTASLSFTRINNLTDSVLSTVKPSLLRDFRSKDSKVKRNSVNFKYRFPINSVESQLGYTYYSTFSTYGSEIRNNNIMSHESKVLGGSKIKNDVQKRILVLSTYDSKSTLVTKSYFKFKKCLKNNKSLNKKNTETAKTIDFFISAKSARVNNFKNLPKVIKFSDKFSFSNNFLSNKVSSKKLNLRSVSFKKKKLKINTLFNRLFLLFFYKSKPILSKFMFKAASNYFNFRYLLNRIRLDHLITNIFLNSTLSYHALELADTVAKNRMGMVKQSLIVKLFSKMRALDNRVTLKMNKKKLMKSKSSISKINNAIILSKFNINQKNNAIRKLKNLFFYNDISIVGGSIVIKKKAKERVNFLKKYKRRLRIKRKLIKFGNFYWNTNPFFFKKRKKFIEFRKKVFKRRSHIQNTTKSRFLKNILQVRRLISGKFVSFEKRLKLDPLPWNKAIDGSGNIVTKYNKKRMLWFTRANVKAYSGIYTYRKAFTFKFFKKQTVAFSEIADRFSNKNLYLLKWYSALIQDNRFGFKYNKRKFLISKLSVTNLFGSKSEPFRLKSATTVPVSKFMKKEASRHSCGALKFGDLLYSFRKKSLRSVRIKVFLNKRKFSYKIKPRLKAKKRLLLRTLSKARFLKRTKYTDWWLFALSPKNRSTVSSRVAQRKMHRIRRLKVKKYFFLKNSYVLVANLLFNLKFGGIPRKQFTRKNNNYSLSTIARANELATFSKIRFNRLKTRSYWSRKEVKHKIINRRRSKVLRRKWKKRKTRLSLFIYKTKKKRFNRFRKNSTIWRYKKKSKYSYAYLWLKFGLSKNFVKKNLRKRSFRGFVDGKNENYNSLETENHYLNKFTDYRVNKSWNFEHNGNYEYSTLLIPNKPFIRYVNRFFNFYRFKKRVFVKLGKRALFRRRSLRLNKTPLNFKALGLFFKKRNKLFISNSFEQTPSDLKDSKVSILEFAKYSKFSNKLSSNVYNFFKDIGLVSNLLFKKKIDKLFNYWSGNSSKLLLLENKSNYFNLENLDSFIIKNLKIYDSIDYVNIFKKSNLIWKSNKIRKFEKKFSIKRRVNRRYFSLFFFNNFAETNLYRLYILNYKKTLRKIGKFSGNRVLKRKIRFGGCIWRMQYMSSNLLTKYSVDKYKVKYNFTKHLAVNRRYVNHLKNNLRGLRDSMRQNVKFLIKKKLAWVRVDKKAFKRLAGWSWKKRYKLSKTPFISLKKRVWSKVKNNYKFKIMDKYDSFVGKTLIRRLRKRLFKRKKLFWTQKRFLIDDSKWGNFGYFWSTISDDYHKFNTEFRKKTFKFPWLKIKPKTYFKKVRAFAWKVKNPLYWRKHGQFAKRFYPKFWYKVFRRKFPLKRHRKDWALKLGKMFAMWPYSKKRYTFYDSSAVYFKNLSINVKPKRHRNPFHYLRKFKMQYVDRDLEIFDFEKDPQFCRKITSRPKGTSFFSWRARVGYRKFSKNIPSFASIVFNSTYAARKLSNIDKKKIDVSDRKIFNIFTKRRSRLLSERFLSYNLYLNIVKKKILPYFTMRRLTVFSKSGLLETKSLSNPVNDSNVTYLTGNSSKYSIVKRNFIQTKTISRFNLLSSFANEASSDFQNLNYKYDILTNRGSILAHFTYLGSQNYWESILYANTSKYRYPDFETAHSMNKLEHRHNLTPLISMNSKLLNKNFDRLQNLTKVKFKKLDFLKQNYAGQYQFTSKVSKFYKKNMWIFSSFEFSSSNYSSATFI